MPSERVRRQIERLLDEAEAALASLDWAQVRARADAVLALDPDNADAGTFRDAANRAQSGGSVAAPPAAAAAPTQERRQVTVLFSDLSGFTSMSERLDPEDVRDIVNKVWARADEIVTRYDGRINKLLGDAVMAVFGDPVAHEDDPLRAVRAALELHEAVEALNRDVEPRIGSPIGMHSGVNTGVVLTSESVLDGKQTGPLGDTINVAARLQSLAKTGQVLVGPETRRAIESTFDLEDLGPHDLKGKGEPVPVARVVALASRQVTPARRSSNFVGRDREISLLRDEYERVRDGGSAYIAISAEAGSGKSRLVEEFRNRVAADATWLEGRAYPFAQSIPYYAITDMISSRLGIDETDSAEAVKEKLTQRVGALVDDAATLLPPLLQLYDIEGSQGSSIDREVYRARLLEALTLLVRKLAERGPLVICLQDLHWADPSTIDLLRQMATVDLPSTLTLYNYRPEFAFHEGGIREIRLSELSGSDTRDLVESLLQDTKIPDALVRLLGERTNGNPFFMEEIVNSLLENNVLARQNGDWTLTGDFDATAMPTTIRGVIASRIDRLDGDRRRILQEASVIGREFMFTVLSQVSGEAAGLADELTALESADLIRKRDAEPDLEYLFKHALTQEVAYQGLLRSKRQELHRRVAQAMEKLLGDRSREYAESIAYHFQNSDLPARSVPYLLIAGKKAIERYALAEAQAQYSAAYAILREQPASSQRDHDLLELINEWCLLHYYTGDINAFKQLMTDHANLLDRDGDAEARAMWLTWHAFVAYSTLAFKDSFAFADRAIEIAQACGSARADAYARAQKCWALMMYGQTRDALASAEAALALVPRLSDERDATYIRIKAGGGAAVAANGAGDFITARRYAKEVLDFAVASGSRRGLSMAHYATALIHNASGDRTRAIADLRQAIEEAPDPIYAAVSEVQLTTLLIQERQTDEARALIDRILAERDSSGLRSRDFLTELNAKVLRIVEGEPGRGLDELEALEATADAMDWPLWRDAILPSTIAGVYASIAMGGGKASLGVIVRNAGFALGRGRRASQIARDRMSRMSGSLPAETAGSRFTLEYNFARLLARRGERDEARQRLQTAMAAIQSLGDSQGMRDARALLAELDAK